ncbi:MAG: hypothetical protein ACK59Y_02865 [Betaproteobacteria bacterium]
MNLLIRLGHWLLVFVVFVAALMGISWLTTLFTAERYFEGAVPSRLFPVVKTAAAPDEYELLRWHQVRAAGESAAQPFRLTEREGHFSVPDHSGFAPLVRFRVSEVAPGRQRIELRLDEDDFVIHAAYETDGRRVSPEYLRVWGPSSYLLAVFPAFVLALVAARWLRRRRQRAAGAAASAASA